MGFYFENTPILYFIKLEWYYLRMKLLKPLVLASISIFLTACLPSPKNSTDTGSSSGSQSSNTSSVPVSPGAVHYYDSITDEMSGDNLKDALYKIIHPAMCTTAYKAIWDYIKYSDAGHPENAAGSPEDDVIAYYRGTTASKSAMNKEHVWPNSRGGSLIEGDPHMVRPTLKSDNTDRGNSFYVEGMNSTTSGWDPKTAGLTESYRGDCARIILYAAVQRKDKLSLIDETNDNTSNNTMGKLSDLLKWNLQYPVSKSEMNRNDILNGVIKSYGKSFNFNRNPFIDHPEYACRIWGTTNSATKQICGM